MATARPPVRTHVMWAPGDGGGVPCSTGPSSLGELRAPTLDPCPWLPCDLADAVAPPPTLALLPPPPPPTPPGGPPPVEKNGPPEAEPAELGEAVGVLVRTLRCATVPNPMMGCFLMVQEGWHGVGGGKRWRGGGGGPSYLI